MTYKTVTDAHALFTHDDKASRKEIHEALGDLDGIEVWGNQVLIAVYCRPSKTTGGIIVGNEVTIEDVWQGKVGLILKAGPDCFTEAKETFGGKKPKIGEWVYHDVKDITVQLSYGGPGYKMTTLKDRFGNEEPARKWQGWPVRLIQDRFIHGRLARPDVIL